MSSFTACPRQVLSRASQDPLQAFAFQVGVLRHTAHVSRQCNGLRSMKQSVKPSLAWLRVCIYRHRLAVLYAMGRTSAKKTNFWCPSGKFLELSHGKSRQVRQNKTPFSSRGAGIHGVSSSPLMWQTTSSSSSSKVGDAKRTDLFRGPCQPAH